MINQVFFKSINELYYRCIAAGFSGSYEEFLKMNIGQVMPYLNISSSDNTTEH